MPPITATHINIYHVCHRELWLHANEIRMESGSELVAEGKFIGETSYADRSERYTEIELAQPWGDDGGSVAGKIDFFDARNRVVHEVKRSDKAETAHVAQVKFYLWLLELAGLTGATGLLEYPKLRRTDEVTLTDDDRADIPRWIADIQRIIGSEHCPEVINKPICKSCSFCDFCYSSEP